MRNPQSELAPTQKAGPLLTNTYPHSNFPNFFVKASFIRAPYPISYTYLLWSNPYIGSNLSALRNQPRSALNDLSQLTCSRISTSRRCSPCLLLSPWFQNLDDS